MQSRLILDLSHEHRVIERLLASLLRTVAQATLGDTQSKPLIARHVEFFRTLLDTLHHGREEQILFEALLATGMSKERGPVAVMLSEHNIGRTCVAALNAIATSGGALTSDELDAIQRNACGFVELLSSHIAKEDGVLYPIAQTRLGSEGLMRIDQEADAWLAAHPHDRAGLVASAEELARSTLVTHSKGVDDEYLDSSEHPIGASA